MKLSCNYKILRIKICRHIKFYFLKGIVKLTIVSGALD